MKKIILLLVFISQAFGPSVAAQTWYEQDIWKQEDRAYQWYPDNQQPKKAKQVSPQDNRRNELVQFEMLQKKLDESRKIAIMNPTEANLREYIQLQELAMSNAASFTDQWQRVIWQNPDLNYSLHGRPTNQLATQEYDYQRQTQKQQAIQQLAGQNGVVFFFRSDCPYCHAMAPVLKQFANQYGIKVMAVSLNGGGIEHFPDALPDNGIATKLAVQAVPAVFVMDTKTQQFKPLGFGVMSQSTLEDRFLAYSKPVGTLY